jgi:hypothetical protein
MKIGALVLVGLVCVSALRAQSPAPTSFPSTVTLGAGALGQAPDAVVIGAAAKTASGEAGLRSVAIGWKAESAGFPGLASGTAYETVALGESALAQGWRCTALGAKAKAGVVSATAVGRGTYAWGAHNIALGRGAYMETLTNGVEQREGNACGIAGESLWLGGMMGHVTVDRTGDTEVVPDAQGGDGKTRWDVRTARPRNYTIHGMDAYDARFVQDPARFDGAKFDPSNRTTWAHRVDGDVRGGDVTLAAGRGTGAGDGGRLVFQTAPAGTREPNRKNELAPAMELDTRRAPGETRMLLYDPDKGTVSRVMVHTITVDGRPWRVLGFPAE